MLVQFLKMFMWLGTWKKLKFKDIKGTFNTRKNYNIVKEAGDFPVFFML